MGEEVNIVISPTDDDDTQGHGGGHGEGHGEDHGGGHGEAQGHGDAGGSGHGDGHGEGHGQGHGLGHKSTQSRHDTDVKSMVLEKAGSKMNMHHFRNFLG